MTRIDSTKIKWRVQYRRTRKHAWANAGLFETRQMARQRAVEGRAYKFGGKGETIGFGNTRVVRHISGKGR